jgi:hypothetical protein
MLKRLKETSIILRVIAVYQIFVWGYSLVLYLKLGISLISRNGSNFLLIIQLMLIIAIIFLLYTNICLLVGIYKKYLSFFLRVNMWSNFIQVFYFSILGLTFYCAFGFFVLLYFSYDRSMEIAVRHSLFESAIGINFDTENSILNIGINVIPLVTFILL